ncbi:helix-turn-helix transcriptional regulator [Commensalibacter sp. M0402]|uniref:helix-turn-helix domain-containing protein n=1 Tax=Commensalibacter TaxID=1079922 RepID=UPI0018DB21E0|nr:MULTISPECIES: helix-turn-helix transcriptional regulator [Commensalibacter]MBI0083631.1 helix-turn-helix transcriptional regulator [Commensalibacter sp. W6292M3]MBI0088774.1 helix-turn-helix transcriptional regulator [Commensalibacter melissae]
MNDLTPFGIAIRQLRIQLRIRMYDMAKASGYSSAFLSSVENGHRPIPDGLVEKIIEKYKLSSEEQIKLHNAYTVTMQKVPTNHLNLRQKEFVATFARLIPDMSDKQLNEIKTQLKQASDNKGENAKWDIK